MVSFELELSLSWASIFLIFSEDSFMLFYFPILKPDCLLSESVSGRRRLTLSRFASLSKLLCCVLVCWTGTLCFYRFCFSIYSCSYFDILFIYFLWFVLVLGTAFAFEALPELW
jgi:hypothetical protein